LLYKTVPPFITIYHVSIILKPWYSAMEFKSRWSLQSDRGAVIKICIPFW